MTMSDIPLAQPSIESARDRPVTPLRLGAAGLIAGLATAAIVQAGFPFFEVPPELLPAGTPSPEQISNADRAQFRVDCLNGAAVGGIYGALTGLLLGFVAARPATTTRQSVRTAVLAGITTAIVGTLAGYLMPYVRSAFGEATVETDLWFTVAVQAFFLGAVGATIGLVLAPSALASGAAGQRIFGGLIGGLIAGAFYPLAAAFLFAGANTESVVPREAGLQFLWLGAAGLLTGLCLAGSTRPQTATPQTATPRAAETALPEGS